MRRESGKSGHAQAHRTASPATGRTARENSVPEMPLWEQHPIWNSMSGRPRWTKAKRVNYARLNSVGRSDIEESEKMSRMEPEHVKEATEEGEVSEVEMAGEKEAAGDAEELSEADIDARVAAAKQEQEDLASKIRVQKKLQMLDALECENRRLRDELARVESESDGTRSLLHAPGGSRQLSFDMNKSRERKQTRQRKSNSISFWPSKRFRIHFTLGRPGKFSKQVAFWRRLSELMVNARAF